MDLKEYKLKIPSELIFLLSESDEKIEMQRNALLLYPYIHNQTISYGRAAEILEMNKYELIDIYEDLGLPYYSMDFSEVEEEIEAFHKLEADLL
ncbi:MAG: UPF0175 family protein [Lachnospiraceae bacterium]|nr:UPF0175 family protein [Lachnospiraceae bacterium]